MPACYPVGRVPRLTLVHLTAIDANPLALLKAAAISGFDSIAPRLVSPGYEDRITPIIGNEPLIRDLISHSNDLDVEIPYVDGLWIGPNTIVADYESAFETAARIGAERFLIVGVDPEESRFIDNFSLACELSSRFGISLAIEFIPYSAIKSLPMARNIIKRAGIPNSGLVVDTLHLYRSGGTFEDLFAVEKDLISILQVSDAPLRPDGDGIEGLRNEARKSRLYLGHGSLPLAEMIQFLPEDFSIGVEVPHASHGHLSVEDRVRLAADTTIAFLHRMNHHHVSQG